MAHTRRRVHLNKPQSNGRVNAYYRVYSEKDICGPAWKHHSDAGSLDSPTRKRVCVDTRESAIRRHNRDSLIQLRGRTVDTLSDGDMENLLEIQAIRRPPDIAWDYT